MRSFAELFERGSYKQDDTGGLLRRLLCISRHQLDEARQIKVGLMHLIVTSLFKPY